MNVFHIILYYNTLYSCYVMLYVLTKKDLWNVHELYCILFYGFCNPVRIHRMRTNDMTWYMIWNMTYIYDMWYMIYIISYIYIYDMIWEDKANKLRSACYMFRFVKPCMSHSSLIMIYYSLFHSVMSSGIIFWGNSSHSQKIFKLQQKKSN
jgi:hypothetical protein